MTLSGNVTGTIPFVAVRSSQGGRTEVRQNSSGSGQDVFRCFVDAAIFPSSGVVSFGSVIINEVGSFHAAVNGWIQCVPDPVLAEAMACREALIWVKENGIQDVELLSDCSSVVEALRDGSFQVRSYLGSLLEDCKTILGGFHSFKISRVPRDANCIAHTLARRANSQPCSWLSSPQTLFLIF
ncbi:hypothetical protein DM860_001602 [Cuscuta australis]|uniref:RNase H type-1 domain-containing protein n=1 Tax=Cuscuta australis TaxID=267555 RepID=A0A328E925_9ASTE|nr:hypothetical protein DM860_001602 [Cuscuta australis]